ncbi:MAG: outer membrane protein assembly factor BamB [Desulfobulbaceae bacterium]|nr:outer membrane protein assembly factor BamB [Desulfobulbaceae bacterium]
MKTIVRVTGLLTSAMVLSACSMFGDDDEKALEPRELSKIVTTVDIKRAWRVKVGGDAEFLRVALQPVGDGNRIYAASIDGNVVALDPATGREHWRTKLDIGLSAGPGVGENLVVVAGSDGYLIALDADTGVERWRVDVTGESLARPAIKDNVVIVLTIDNRLRALSAFDGSERWVFEQSTPLLTMRGSATPAIIGSTVVAGFDNGRLAAVDIASGDVVWEALLAPPSGRSDLERLSDVDGLISVVGQDLYAAGYQGKLAALASESGQVLWVREVSSFEGVSADWINVYTVNEEGELIALSRNNGTEAWRQDALLRREPTLPVPFHTTVAVGDLDGYLHFFSTIDGKPVARLKVDGNAISNDPVVVADRLYVQSDSGSLSAYVVQQPKSSRKARDTEDNGA